MKTCIERESQNVVSADAATSSVHGYICNECHMDVILNRGSATVKAHFKHKVANEYCQYSIRQPKKPDVDEEEVSRATRKHENFSWHRGWQGLASKGSREVRGIGGDSRPRDVGCANTGNIVELQHSRMSGVEFQERNRTVPRTATWIFDATDVRVFVYNKFQIDGQQVYFCCDEFRETYATGSGKVQVLFHCSDGKVRQACCDSAVKIVLEDSTELFVRLLRDLSEAALKTLSYFFKERWPLQDWADKKLQAIGTVLDPIRVFSEEGREVVDKMHRESFMTFPVKPLTIYNAPPGAGKTTALKAAVRAWTSSPHRKKVLVIVFNKSNQVLLQKEMCMYRGCTVKTLDALCFQGVPRKFDEEGDECSATFHANFNDWNFVKTYVPHCKTKEEIVIKLKTGGGARSSSIVQHRLRHPRATHTLCMKHKRLFKRCADDVKNKDWDASLDTFPIEDIVRDVATFTARRYVCDRDCLLRKLFRKYDCLLVDERQDLASGQEMRLIRQAECPIVMVGDNDQTINDFRHEMDYKECCKTGCCELPPEDKPGDLPPVIEWYNTYRLDALTVKWLEDMTGKRMFSHRKKDEVCTLKWSSKMIHSNTLTVCRFNITAIRMAIKFHGDGMRVINGAQLSKDLEADARRITPEARQRFKEKKPNDGRTNFILDLEQSGKLQGVVAMLLKQDISLCDVNSGNFLAVTVVHQIKGFECDHVAVHQEFIQRAVEEATEFPENRCERNCLLVAFSRHRKSLVILSDIIVPPVDAQPTLPVQTIDDTHFASTSGIFRQ